MFHIQFSLNFLVTANFLRNIASAKYKQINDKFAAKWDGLRVFPFDVSVLGREREGHYTNLK